MFIRLVERLSFAAGIAAGAAIILILGLICVEVVLRNFFGRSTMIADEFAGYLNVAVVFLGLGYTLRERGFIRIELLYERLRGHALVITRWLITFASIAYVAVLLFYAIKQVVYMYQGNIRSDNLSEAPLYIPQLLVVIGCALLLLQLLTYVVNRVRNVP